MRAELIASLMPVTPAYDLRLPAKLSAQERVELDKREAIIAEGLSSFERVGDAMLDIRENQWYRETHGTFQDYCRDRWQIGARRAQQVTAGRKVVKNIEESGAHGVTRPTILPSNEKQVRPLVGLPEEKQREVWSEAVKTAPAGKPISARHVQETAERLAPKQREPVLQDPMIGIAAEITEPDERGHWPKPHLDGTYSSAGAETLKFKHPLLRAEVLALEICQRVWISCRRYCFATGTCQSGDSMLRASSQKFTDRNAALHDALKDLRDIAMVIVRGQSDIISIKQRKVSKMLAEWCSTRLRELGSRTESVELDIETEEPQIRRKKWTTEKGAVDAVTLRTAQTVFALMMAAEGRPASWGQVAEVERRACVEIARWHLAEMSDARLGVKAGGHGNGVPKKKVSASSRRRLRKIRK